MCIRDREKIVGIEGDEEGRVKGIIFENGDKLAFDGLFVAEGTASALDFATKLGLEVKDLSLIHILKWSACAMSETR